MKNSNIQKILNKNAVSIQALVENTYDLTNYINFVEGDSLITLTDTMDSNGAINYIEISNTFNNKVTGLEKLLNHLNLNKDEDRLSSCYILSSKYSSKKF